MERYLLGERITEADWRLFTTLVRFDAVYGGHFKCNLKRIADYDNISGYLRELYQYPGIKETVNFQHPLLSAGTTSIQEVWPARTEKRRRCKMARTLFLIGRFSTPC